ncbi:unnamed protein product [Closterium sp. Naga37s-1]|nr:unnamed protein product [Closterium sp. Naga37s-1]
MPSRSRKKLKEKDISPNHSMSPRQFAALTAVCDTLVSSMPVPTDSDDPYFQLVGKRKEGAQSDSRWSEFYGEPRKEAITAYFAESASSLGIVDKVATTMQQCVKPLPLVVFGTVLWLLSTRLGTLLLAGRRAFTRQPPFVQPFAKLSPQAREAVLLRWSVSSNFLLRTVFKTFRSFTLFHVGAQREGSGDNMQWRAMGYCGPDPNMLAAGKQRKYTSSSSRDSSAACDPDVAQRPAQRADAAQRPAQRSDNGEGETEREEGTARGDSGGGGGGREEKEGEARPLDAAVVDCAAEGAGLAAVLQGKGVEVLPGPRQTIGLMGRREKGEREPVVVRCDAVVIGSGCGGAIIAAQLAEAAAAAGGDNGGDGSGQQRKVVVLEAGGYFFRSDLSLLEAPSAQMCDTQGFLTTEDGGIALLAGRTVGGGSAVNWSASFRTPPHVTKEWASEYGLKQFESQEYTAAMDAVCEKIQVTADESLTPHSLSNAALKAGCAALRCHHAVTPRNTNQPHPLLSGLISLVPLLVPTLTLPSPHPPSRRLPLGYPPLPGACTTPGAASSSAAAGVREEARGGGGGEGRAAGRRVACGRWVACGSLHTPPLLLASGLTNPAIGASLRLHPVTSAWGFFPETFPFVSPLTPSLLHTPPLLLASGLTSPAIGASLRLHPVTSAWGFFPETAPSLPPSLPAGPGYLGPIMSVNSRETANWETSGYGAMIQTPTMHPGLLGCAIPWLGSQAIKQSAVRFDRIASLISIVRDRGRGTVRVDGSGRPVVTYRLCKEDQKSMQEALLLSLRILRAAGAMEVGTLHQSLKPFRCLLPPPVDADTADAAADAASGRLDGTDALSRDAFCYSSKVMAFAVAQPASADPVIVLLPDGSIRLYHEQHMQVRDVLREFPHHGLASLNHIAASGAGAPPASASSGYCYATSRQSQPPNAAPLPPERFLRPGGTYCLVEYPVLAAHDAISVNHARRPHDLASCAAECTASDADSRIDDSESPSGDAAVVSCFTPRASRASTRQRAAVATTGGGSGLERAASMPPIHQSLRAALMMPTTPRKPTTPVAASGAAALPPSPGAAATTTVRPLGRTTSGTMPPTAPTFPNSVSLRAPSSAATALISQRAPPASASALISPRAPPASASSLISPRAILSSGSRKLARALTALPRPRRSGTLAARERDGTERSPVPRDVSNHGAPGPWSLMDLVSPKGRAASASRAAQQLGDNMISAEDMYSWENAIRDLKISRGERDEEGEAESNERQRNGSVRYGSGRNEARQTNWSGGLTPRGLPLLSPVETAAESGEGAQQQGRMAADSPAPPLLLSLAHMLLIKQQQWKEPMLMA